MFEIQRKELDEYMSLKGDDKHIVAKYIADEYLRDDLFEVDPPEYMSCDVYDTSIVKKLEKIAYIEVPDKDKRILLNQFGDNEIRPNIYYTDILNKKEWTKNISKEVLEALANLYSNNIYKVIII